MIASAINTLAQAYPTLEGSRILKVMNESPNRPVRSTALEIALHTGLDVEQAEKTIYHPSAIPMVDSKTLLDIDRRMIALIDAKAHYLTEIGGTSSPFDVEIAALTKYRKECTKPNGSPKSFPDEDRRAYRRQAAAIRRLLEKAEKDGHYEAVAIVKQNLRLGRTLLLCDESGTRQLEEAIDH